MQTFDDRVVAGHVMGFDSATGFGLVRALGRLGARCPWATRAR